MSTTFAERCKESRLNKGLTQVQVGRALGIRHETVVHWEKGYSKSVRTTHLFALSRLLGVDPEWLANGVVPSRRKAKRKGAEPAVRAAGARRCRASLWM